MLKFRARVHMIGRYLHSIGKFKLFLRNAMINLFDSKSWCKLVADLLQHENKFKKLAESGKYSLVPVTDNINMEKFKAHLRDVIDHQFAINKDFKRYRRDTEQWVTDIPKSTTFAP